jgi:1-acyl-sn-glycerol-3-phosphate acyltransferase
LLFFAVFFSYLTLVMEPIQWLVLGPLGVLQPSRHEARLRAWLRSQSRLALALARLLAGVRVEVRGAIEPSACIVVMNHQSIFDIPVGVSLISGPYPLIPARASYRRGIPGISSLLRLMRSPLLEQRSQAARSELLALRDAADQVARGERSMIIYPEGHRSRNDTILPFMKPGLRLILSRAADRPVYAVVCHGLGHLRTFKETALGIAGSRVRVAIAGPYNIPAGNVEQDRFIDWLRDRMVETQAGLRPHADEPHRVEETRDLRG